MATDPIQNVSPKGKMGCVKIAGIVILVLVGLSVLSAILGTEKSKSKSSTQAASAVPEQPPMQVTARELEDAYEKNEAAAQQKYGKRPLLVSGTIESIDLDFSDEPFLSLKSANSFVGPQLSLTEQSQAKAPSLSKGQKIKALCQSIGEIVGRPMLKDCELQ